MTCAPPNRAKGLLQPRQGPPRGALVNAHPAARTPKRRHRATWLQAKYECDSASMSSDTLRQQVKRGGVAVRLPRLRTHRCAAVSRQGTTTGRLTFLCVPLRELPTTVRCPVSNCGTQIMSPMCYQLHHNALRDACPSGMGPSERLRDERRGNSRWFWEDIFCILYIWGICDVLVFCYIFCIWGILVICTVGYSFGISDISGMRNILVYVYVPGGRARAQRLEGSGRSRQRPQPAPPPGRSGRPRDRLRELSGTPGRLREGTGRSGSLRDEHRGSSRRLGDAPGGSGRLWDGLREVPGRSRTPERLPKGSRTLRDFRKVSPNSAKFPEMLIPDAARRDASLRRDTTHLRRGLTC